MTDEVPKILTPPPGPKSLELLDRQERVLYPGFVHDVAPFVVASKEGWTLTDVDGNVYLDMISASASVPLGAARADITEAAVGALRRFGNEDAHGVSHEMVAPLAERLLAIAPPGLTRVDIALNGTEAVETAVRFIGRTRPRRHGKSFCKSPSKPTAGER